MLHVFWTRTYVAILCFFEFPHIQDVERTKQDTTPRWIYIPPSALALKQGLSDA
jgi:hypothetical protein